jgi:serine/threonine-protein kinase
MADDIPTKVGDYEIDRKLGEGGMAAVYLGRDSSGKSVAIKILPRQFTFDPQFRGRFSREARVLGGLSHPAIVPVYDFGEDDQQPFLVMAFMGGGSLAGRIRQGKVTTKMVTAVVERIGSALDYAHAQGIVHRDLKPDNILLDENDQPFLSDFGIVKLAEQTVSFTGSKILGTPAYMSPEQVHGSKALDGRSDLYSLGIILFEMLTGRQPYEAETATDVLIKHLVEPVPNIQEVSPGIPAAYQPVIARVLAKSPDERYANGAELAADLAALIRQQPPRRLGAVGAPGWKERIMARPWMLAPALLLLLIPCVAIVGIALVVGGNGPQPSPTAGDRPAVIEVEGGTAATLSPQLLATLALELTANSGGVGGSEATPAAGLTASPTRRPTLVATPTGRPSGSATARPEASATATAVVANSSPDSGGGSGSPVQETATQGSQAATATNGPATATPRPATATPRPPTTTPLPPTNTPIPPSATAAPTSPPAPTGTPTPPPPTPAPTGTAPPPPTGTAPPPPTGTPPPPPTATALPPAT